VELSCNMMHYKYLTLNTAYDAARGMRPKLTPTLINPGHPSGLKTGGVVGSGLKTGSVVGHENSTDGGAKHTIEGTTPAF